METQLELGTLAHAELLISAVASSKSSVQNEQLGDLAQSIGEVSTDMKPLVGALGQVTAGCLETLEKCFQREHDILMQYQEVCAEIEVGVARLDESHRCISFIDAGLNGRRSTEDLSNSENVWLSSLSTELRVVEKKITNVTRGKSEEIRQQIDEIQGEVDQANELLKKLRAETMEPPSTVLQSLSASDSDPDTNDPEIEYEDSIDQYIEWMKGQREQIKQQRARIDALDRRMVDAEEAIDRKYAEQLGPLNVKRSELKRSLQDALSSARKDAEETETRMIALRQDAATLVSEVNEAMTRRLNFATDLEDTMASVMIRLGRVLDESALASSPARVR